MAAAVPGVPQDRLAGLVALFDDATAAAAMAGGEAALAGELRRMSGFYRDVGDLLRHARAAAARERSRCRGPGRARETGTRWRAGEEPGGPRAKRGRAAGAGPAARDWVTGGAAAGSPWTPGSCPGELSGDEEAPVALGEGVEGAGPRTCRLAGELPGVIAGFTGIEEWEVARAGVEQGFRELAGQLAAELDLAGSEWAGPEAAGVLEPGVLGDGVVYAGAGGRVAGVHLEVAGRYARLLAGVNPLRERGGEFATNCVLTVIAVDLALGEGEGFRAGAAGLAEVADVERYAGRSLAVMDGYAGVAGAVRAAGPGARGIVLVRGRGLEHDHAVSVVHDEGRVVFLDGQAGRLAVLPADPAMVRLVLTAADGVPGQAAARRGSRRRVRRCWPAVSSRPPRSGSPGR